MRSSRDNRSSTPEGANDAHPITETTRVWCTEEDCKFHFPQQLAFVARRWRTLMNESLRGLGQTEARWIALSWIEILGESVHQTELAELLGVEHNTLGRILQDLESGGFIERRFGKGDRRAKTIRLTAAVRIAMKDMSRIQTAVRDTALEGIDPGDLRTCASVFARVLVNMDES